LGGEKMGGTYTPAILAYITPRDMVMVGMERLALWTKVGDSDVRWCRETIWMFVVRTPWCLW
jgi:hypothetical protein